MVVPTRRPARFLGPARNPLRPVVIVVLVLAAVVVGLVLLGSGNTSEREARTQTLAYVDQVRPLIDQSTIAGNEIRKLREDAADLGRDGLDRQLGRWEAETDGTLARTRTIQPPEPAELAHDLLIGAMAGRAGGVRRLRESLSRALVADSPSLPAVQELVEVGRDFLAADGAYRLFLRNLPPQLPVPPDSQWVADDKEWSVPVVDSFVKSLRSSENLAPVHDVAVLLLSANPAPVGMDGPVSVLPFTKTVQLEVVLANNGNTPEKQIELAVAIEPLNGSQGDRARANFDLDPGQRRAISMRELAAPPPGQPFAVTAKVGPVAGDANPVDDELVAQYVIH